MIGPRLLGVLLSGVATAVALAGMATASAAADSATITFRKVFKSSYPEFVEIKVSQSGTGSYDIRQLDETAKPEAFQVGAPLVEKIFSLTAKLHNFQGVDLEVHKRLASLGEKTLRYDSGGESHEVTFNYTLDPAGTELTNLFENLSRQEGDLSDLMRTMRYDRLGVNDVLLQVENDYNGNLLPEPERFVTLLDQLAADTKYIDVARERARKLSDRVRSGGSTTATTK
jgi:hypothetical protein